MKVVYDLNLPSYYGKVVEERLKLIDLNKKYSGYTLLDDLSIIESHECSIGSDGSYNYHNNYDDSQNVLKVDGIHKWWTFSEDEIGELQKSIIDKEVIELKQEINRLTVIKCQL